MSIVQRIVENACVVRLAALHCVVRIAVSFVLRSCFDCLSRLKFPAWCFCFPLLVRLFVAIALSSLPFVLIHLFHVPFFFSNCSLNCSLKDSFHYTRRVSFDLNVICMQLFLKFTVISSLFSGSYYTVIHSYLLIVIFFLQLLFLYQIDAHE